MVKLHKFRLIKTCAKSGARTAELITQHGIVSTPVFLPVGTQGSVKTLTPEEIKSIGIEMILANAYHLYLRPGIEIIKKSGGLHKFMGWDKAMLTDSGGYQIFSLARLRQINDEGVTFRSHIDGSEILLTPELIIRVQEALGADVIMVLDECLSHDESFEKLKTAMERTHRWAERCQKAQRNDSQALYAIIQGGTYPELRSRSAEYLTSLDFAGYAIGGLSIGEPKDVTLSIINHTIPLLPQNKPRYLMGVGSPENIIEGVAKGIDIFDSALPTRVARNGAVFTPSGRINIRNSIHRRKEQPVVAECTCYTCHNFSVAYLHHLFRCEELLAYRLASIHNLHFMNDLMCKIRNAVLNDTFIQLKENFLEGYKTTDEGIRLTQKKKWLARRIKQG